MHLHQGKHGMKNDSDSKAIRMGQSSRVLMTGSQYYLKPRTVSISGVLLGNCSLTPDQQYLGLQNLVGLPTDVIGYVVIGCCSVGGCDCCACEAPSNCDVQWLHTRGQLQSVELDTRGNQLKVKLTLVIDTFWKALDRGIWQYTIHPPSPFGEAELPITGRYTDDLCVGGTASAQSADLPADNAFDDDLTTDWRANAGSPQWIEYNFGSNVYTIKAFSIRATQTGASIDETPHTFTLQYYDIGTSTWQPAETIPNQTGWGVNERRQYDVQGNFSSNRWRINITQVQGGGTNPRICEIEMMQISPSFWLNVIKAYPTCDMLFKGGICWTWVKRVYSDDFYHYDPDFLFYLHKGHRLGYPPTGVNINWSDTEIAHMINVDMSYWNAPPLSVYQLRRLTNITKVYIRVQRVTDVWQPRFDETFLDVVELNTRMVAGGYPVLNDNDRVIVGQVFNAPGLIIRGDNSVITDVVMPISYFSEFPGFLSPGLNRVQIASEGLSGAFPLSAQSHTFRRM